MAVGQDISRQLAFMQRVNPNWNPSTSFIGQRLIGALPRSMRDQFTAPGTGASGAGVSPTPGTIPGAAPLPGYTSEAGGIPGTTSPSQSMSDLIAGLLGQTGNISKLTSDLTAARTGALRQEYPQEYFDTLATSIGNVGRRAQGIMSDLLPELATGAAEWGIGAGVPGSPAYETKLARDLGLTRYGIEREAIGDLGRLKGLIPTTEPYNVERFVPTTAEQSMLQLLANQQAAAPLPEAAFRRNLNLALEGLNRGYGGSAGGGVTRYGNAPGPSTNWPTLSAAPSPVNIALGPGVRPTVAAPTGPGWGQSWGTGGGYASAGAVPFQYAPGQPGGPPNDWLSTQRILPGLDEGPPPLDASEDDWLAWLARDEDYYGQ